MTAFAKQSRRAWTRDEFEEALRHAGWYCGYPPTLFISPDDKTVVVEPDRIVRHLGRVPLWAYFAARRELPATTPPPF